MRTLNEYAALINARLEILLPKLPNGACDIDGGMPALLSDAMRYSLLAGGKRLRPAMMLAACEMLGGNCEEALDAACAVEMIHTYSLIHDDLPGMDDDVLRRGRATNHVVFGVGQAILAGDGLLNFAFEKLLANALRHPENAQNHLRAAFEIACGAGAAGMIGGQCMDLSCERSETGGAAELEYIHLNKTACMFIHPLRAAGHIAGADAEKIDAFGRYGEAFGLLFQATDDLLDVHGNVGELGKSVGKDETSGKLTCLSVLGEENARARVLEMRARALAALAGFGEEADFFRLLIDDMVDRTK